MFTIISPVISIQNVAVAHLIPGLHFNIFKTVDKRKIITGNEKKNEQSHLI